MATHLPEAGGCAQEAGCVEQVICAAPGRSSGHSRWCEGAIGIARLGVRGKARCPRHVRRSAVTRLALVRRQGLCSSHVSSPFHLHLLRANMAVCCSARKTNVQSILGQYNYAARNPKPANMYILHTSRN